MNNTTLQNLKKIESDQKRWDKFQNTIVWEYTQNKQEYKGKKLANGMSITGIGEKCLKVENNFYSWEDIETAATQGTEDGIMKEIINFIFSDSPYADKQNTYTAKKWKRSEAIQNFDIIKEEIIENKAYYKIGEIIGIGEKSVCITGYGGEKEYISWEEIQKNLKENTIKDYKIENNWSSISHLDVFAIIVDELFIDDEEETTVEKNLREKDVEYADEKAYVYRHILKEDLTVEKIRRIVRINRKRSSEDTEGIVNELLQFAFKYVKEVKFTDNDYDEEDYNKYAVQSDEGYFYVIKNKEIEYNEEQEGYTFKDYKKAVFKAEKGNIQVIRKGKVVYNRRGGIKAFLVGVRKHSEVQIAFELSPAQQVEILRKERQLKEVTDDEIQAYFIKTVQSEYSEIGNEIKETIEENYKEDIRKAYTEYESIQAIAKEIYKEGRIHAGPFYTYLNAVASEPHVDKSRIIDFVAWSDSSTTDSILYDDKYEFNETYESKDVTLQAGFNSKTYTYTENTQYTKIEHSSAHIDSFSVETVYIKGHLTEQEIPHYLEYAYGMWAMRNTLKYGFLYEETLKDGRTFSYKL